MSAQPAHTPEDCPAAARLDERVKVVEADLRERGAQVDDIRFWRARLTGYVAGGVLVGTFFAQAVFVWIPKLFG